MAFHQQVVCGGDVVVTVVLHILDRLVDIVTISYHLLNDDRMHRYLILAHDDSTMIIVLHLIEPRMILDLSQRDSLGWISGQHTLDEIST